MIAKLLYCLVGLAVVISVYFYIDLDDLSVALIGTCLLVLLVGGICEYRKRARRFNVQK